MAPFRFGLVAIMRYEMKSKHLFALVIIAVSVVPLFLAVSIVPVVAQPHTVTVIISDPSHTHGAVIIGQNCQPIPPCGARSHVFELSAQTQLDADTWSVSIPLTADITPFVPWTDTSLPITVGVYDLRDSHYNSYSSYFLQGDFTGTFVVCYSPDVPVGGLCPVTHTPHTTPICVIQLAVQEQNGTSAWLPGYGYPGTPISQCKNSTDVLGQDVLGRTIVLHQFNQTR